VVDEYLHRIFAPAHPGGGIDLLPWPLSWVCDKHEAVLLRSVGEDPKPYLEEDRRRRREIRRRARRLRKYH
jgi:hypothetical protein